MVSRCSHRISPAVQSDIRSRKASLFRQHSSQPCRPLSSEPRHWRPNSAWHQSSQWLTSHSDHEVGSKHVHESKCPGQYLYLHIDSSSPPGTEISSGLVPGGKRCLIISWVKPAKLAFIARLRTSLLAGVRGGTSSESSSGTKVKYCIIKSVQTTNKSYFCYCLLT